jgi:hypothetical protein
MMKLHRFLLRRLSGEGGKQHGSDRIVFTALLALFLFLTKKLLKIETIKFTAWVNSGQKMPKPFFVGRPYEYHTLQQDLF